MKIAINHFASTLIAGDSCTNGNIRGVPKEHNTIFVVEYCTGEPVQMSGDPIVSSWHYLCASGANWNSPTLATVACRQLGNSDKGKVVYA